MEDEARPTEPQANAPSPASPSPPAPAPASSGESALKTIVLFVAALVAVVGTFLILQVVMGALGFGGG